MYTFTGILINVHNSKINMTISEVIKSVNEFAIPEFVSSSIVTAI